MERQWTGNATRLSQADRSEIERLIQGGETFATAAAAVGSRRRRFSPWAKSAGS